MSSGELSFGSPPFLYVTWKIPAFFQQASRYYLQSPRFPFADVRHCLRLFSYRDIFSDYVQIKLMKLTDTIPQRNFSYEVGLKSRTGTEIGLERELTYLGESSSFCIHRSELEEERYSYFPDGTLTVFCSVRLKEESTSGSEAESQVFKYFISPLFETASSNFRLSGELSYESPSFLHVTWKIPDFFQLAEQSGYSVQSPEFNFADGHYCLRSSPCKIAQYSNCARIEVVNLTDTVPGTDVSYEVVLKSRTGKEKELCRNVTSIISLGQISFYFEQSELKSDKNASFPDGTLIVFCFVRPRELNKARGHKSSEGVFPGLKVTPPQVSATPPQSGGAETSDEEEEQEGLPGITKLQSDYRQLLQKEAESDACLVVSGKEFRAHKIILRARSLVFDAMFSHETAEKESGRVVIKDLDPESFGDFLEYLYTGGVGAGLSDENACGLYKAADKYEVLTLKSECVAHMRRNLSVDSFCDVMTLALQHQEQKLLKKAIRFFKKNIARIVVTVKWQQFVIDNGTAANELLIKAIVPGEK